MKTDLFLFFHICRRTDVVRRLHTRSFIQLLLRSSNWSSWMDLKKSQWRRQHTVAAKQIHKIVVVDLWPSFATHERLPTNDASILRKYRQWLSSVYRVHHHASYACSNNVWQFVEIQMPKFTTIHNHYRRNSIFSCSSCVVVRSIRMQTMSNESVFVFMFTPSFRLFLCRIDNDVCYERRRNRETVLVAGNKCAKRNGNVISPKICRRKDNKCFNAIGEQNRNIVNRA